MSSTNSRVQVFTPEGEFLTGFLVEGDAPGQFLLPHAIALDSLGFIYIADSSNHRIQKIDARE